MTIDRRRFIALSGLGAAAWATGVRGHSAGGIAAAAPRDARQGATLELTIWGSFLYAFPANRRRLELGCLTANSIVSGCPRVPHRPAIQISSGTLDPASPLELAGPEGHVPAGVYRLVTDQGAPPLAPQGLGEPPGDCPADGAVRSLRYLPQLRAAKGHGLDTWRDQFGTRFGFETGSLRAGRPLHSDGGTVPRWRVTGPGAGGPYVFTDTVVLTVPLASGRARFERSDGEWFDILPTEGATSIVGWLLASPVDAVPASPVRGERDLHFCALYSAFDPPPAPRDRAELIFEGWCGEEQAIPAQGFRPMGRRAFDPSKVCGGGWVEVP